MPNGIRGRHGSREGSLRELGEKHGKRLASRDVGGGQLQQLKLRGKSARDVIRKQKTGIYTTRKQGCRRQQLVTPMTGRFFFHRRKDVGSISHIKWENPGKSKRAKTELLH